VDWAPLLRTSAKTGRGVDRIWPALGDVLASRATRIPTAGINQWLERAVGRTPPPVQQGRSVKLRYATQARTEPPEIVVFSTARLSPSYTRYLENDLRRTFGFEGTPLRLVVRVRKREPRGAGERPRRGRG
jgi:GTP-binding protein